MRATYGQAKYCIGDDAENEIVVVRPEHVDHYWLKASELLYPAIEYCHGKFSIEDVYKRLKASTAFLWLAFEGDEMVSVGVTWVDVYPQSRTLTLGFGAGKMEGLTDMLPWVFEYAEQLECDAIECQGRGGWRRVLRRYGFDKVSYTVRMHLEKKS